VKYDNLTFILQKHIFQFSLLLCNTEAWITLAHNSQAVCLSVSQFAVCRAKKLRFRV